MAILILGQVYSIFQTSRIVPIKNYLRICGCKKHHCGGLKSAYVLASCKVATKDWLWFKLLLEEEMWLWAGKLNHFIKMNLHCYIYWLWSMSGQVVHLFNLGHHSKMNLFVIFPIIAIIMIYMFTRDMNE